MPKEKIPFYYLLGLTVLIFFGSLWIVSDAFAASPVISANTTAVVSSSVNTVTFSFTVTPGDNLLLIHTTSPTGAVSPLSGTWNTSETLTCTSAGVSSYQHDNCLLQNPTSGTHNIVLNFSAFTASMGIVAESITNGGGIDTVSSIFAGTTGHDKNDITPGFGTDLLIKELSNQAADNGWTDRVDETNIASFAFGSGLTKHDWVSWKNATSTNSHSMVTDFSNAGGNASDQYIIAITYALGGGGGGGGSGGTATVTSQTVDQQHSYFLQLLTATEYLFFFGFVTMMIISILTV